MNTKIWFLFTLFAILLSVTSVLASNVDSVKLTANLLNQNPDSAVPGDYLELRFNVFKTGNLNAENIQFKLNVDHPFYFDSSDTPIRNLALLKGQSGDDWYYTLYYKILVSDDAIKGDYEIELKYNYNDLNIWNVQKFTIRVDEKKEPNFVFGNLITIPRKLLSGTDESKIDIELQNIGKGDSENVILDVELPDGFNSTYAYSNRVNLGTINTAQSKIATIYLDIDKKVIAKEYLAKVTVSYKDTEADNSDYKTKILYLTIPIKEKPYLKIIGQEVLNEENVIYAGSNVKIKMLIENIGAKEAKSVSLRVLKDSSHPFDLVEKSDFIGNIEVNEKGEAVISFDVNPAAVSKKYKLNVEIRSVSDDTVFIDDDSIIIDVVNMPKSKNSLFIYILLIVLLGVIVFFAYKVRKKNVKSKVKNKKK
jgi:hypothetical protein